MAMCPVCNREMLVAKGCTHAYIMFGDSPKLYKRERVHDGNVNEAGRCFDCGAKIGGLHHDGCDTEQCPRCGSQALGCECTMRTESFLVKKTYSKV